MADQPLQTNLQQNFRLSFSIASLLILIAMELPIFGQTEMDSKSQPDLTDYPGLRVQDQLQIQNAYDLLEKKAETISSENHKNGWAYIVSGGATLAASIPAYYLSEDVFAKVIYTVGETVGIAAVGYGSYLVLMNNDYTRFHRIIQGVPGLSKEERIQLSERFLEESAERSKSVRRIRVITHSLAAGLNFLDGLTSSNQNLKIAHFFLGGINTLAAVSFGFSKSEEENFAGSVLNQKKTKIELIIGSMVGIKVSF